ncbi:patatin-like phospholipase family protein [Accumulibacter sp.]|uniref:patatin-like phospholipase family protein n=1 Tax=Accumulibacter sp. TaxID=2053492 RepID=UPI00260BD0AD|nr:patatin-like phospholipase family protein [Accumulibacter sp.]
MTGENKSEEWFNAAEAIQEEARHIEHARAALKAFTPNTRLFAEPSGLCLSGGGIRSAAFATGFLQALAERGQISRFDYMSSVSGGGYAMGWWMALVHRITATDDDPAHQVVNKAVLGEKTISPHQQGEQPFVLRHVRAHGNYLTLRTGLLSTDTAAALSTILRNMVYGLAALGLLAVAVSWQALAIAAFIEHWGPQYAHVLAFVAAVPLCVGWWNSCKALNRNLKGKPGPATATWLIVGALLVGLHFAATDKAIATGVGLPEKPLAGANFAAVCLLLTCAAEVVVLSCVYFYRMMKGISNRPIPWTLGGTIAVSVAACAAWLWIPLEPKLATRGPLPVLPYVAWLMLLMGHAWESALLHGRLFDGWDSVRHKTRVQITSAGLMTSICLVLLSMTPYLVSWVLRVATLIAPDPPDLLSPAAVFVALLAVFAVLVNAVMAVSEGSQEEPVHREWWARWSGELIVAAIVATVGCVAVSSASRLHPSPVHVVYTGLGALALFGLSTILAARPATRLLARVLGLLTVGAIAGMALVMARVIDNKLAWVVAEDWPLYMSGPIAAFFVLSVLVLTASGPNSFSMHDFYRNRLNRAFLGASNTKRNPLPTVGIDEGDDPMLRDLIAGKGEAAIVYRPFPVWCAAVNVTTERRLGLSERKAASFVFTPLRAGFHVATLERSAKSTKSSYRAMAPVSEHGRESQEVGYEVEPLTMGTAIATSAAAFSTNTGSTTTPERALVLALLGARLGRWFPNPASENGEMTPPLPSEAWKIGLPTLHLKDKSWVQQRINNLKASLFVREALSRCDIESNAVYITDGGHFENLGVYEMIRRRAKLIVCADASCDPRFRFDDLLNLQTRVRTDFGAEIEITGLDDLVSDHKGRLAKVAFKRWRVVYARDSEGRPEDCGEFIYCKSTITGDEPADLADYRRRVTSFPHVSTLDQWFAESTFEAYRTLGLHIGRNVAHKLSGM